MTKELKLYTENWNFMDTTGLYPSMSGKNFPIAFFSIISLFAEDADFNLEKCYVDRERLFIDGESNEESNELMLRYNYGANNSLVVARVGFIHKREGKMTELYRILMLIQQKYHTGPIVIESVLTEEMHSWCEKNDFYKDEIREGNFIQPQC